MKKKYFIFEISKNMVIGNNIEMNNNYCFNDNEITIIFDKLYEDQENKHLFNTTKKQYLQIKKILPNILQEKIRKEEEYKDKIIRYTHALNTLLESTNDTEIKSLLPQPNMGNPIPPKKFSQEMIHELYSSKSTKEKIDKIIWKYD